MPLFAPCREPHCPRSNERILRNPIHQNDRHACVLNLNLTYKRKTLLSVSFIWPLRSVHGAQERAGRLPGEQARRERDFLARRVVQGQLRLRVQARRLVLHLLREGRPLARACRDLRP